MTESFERMLSGGHHNSLGRTLEIVHFVLEDKRRLAELYECYFSGDELVQERRQQRDETARVAAHLAGAAKCRPSALQRKSWGSPQLKRTVLSVPVNDGRHRPAARWSTRRPRKNTLFELSPGPVGDAPDERRRLARGGCARHEYISTEGSDGRALKSVV